MGHIQHGPFNLKSEFEMVLGSKGGGPYQARLVDPSTHFFFIFFKKNRSGPFGAVTGRARHISFGP